MKRVLFLSYDGMTDPLGQSQVIPYLAGLSALGYQIEIVSFEKEENFGKNEQLIGELLKKCHIAWHPLPYTASPPILSTLWDLLKLRSKVKSLMKDRTIDLLHCRGYITAHAGLAFKRKYGCKFLFDMRAFFADERVDGGHWNQKKLLYRWVYRYFKHKEQQFLSRSDYTISLTEAGKSIIHRMQHPAFQPSPVQVIPCCADLNHFRSEQVPPQTLETLKETLHLKNKKVVSYLGSLGTWYLENEMFQFFGQYHRQNPESVFLLITPDPPSKVEAVALRNKIPLAAIRVKSAKRNEVPSLLALSDFSIFFIQPLFSKQGSSPTKHGEILGMGIPVICNSGVGDVAEITKQYECGLLVNEFTQTEYERVLSELPTLLSKPKEVFRRAAQAHYSLEEGVRRYAYVYGEILR